MKKVLAVLVLSLLGSCLFAKTTNRESVIRHAIEKNEFQSPSGDWVKFGNGDVVLENRLWVKTIAAVMVAKLKAQKDGYTSDAIERIVAMDGKVIVSFAKNGAYFVTIDKVKLISPFGKIGPDARAWARSVLDRRGIGPVKNLEPNLGLMSKDKFYDLHARWVKGDHKRAQDPYSFVLKAFSDLLET